MLKGKKKKVLGAEQLKKRQQQVKQDPIQKLVWILIQIKRYLKLVKNTISGKNKRIYIADNNDKSHLDSTLWVAFK